VKRYFDPSRLLRPREGRLNNVRRYSFSRVAPREAHRKLESAQAILVDVREEDEWKAGRVPTAVHIPLGELSQEAGALPREKEILLICRSGRRSSAAASNLAERGFRTTNVEGGARAWTEEGLPFEGRVA
jgi:rhodanese-related sulfurtransferase